MQVETHAFRDVFSDRSRDAPFLFKSVDGFCTNAPVNLVWHRSREIVKRRRVSKAKIRTVFVLSLHDSAANN